jgi:hypothetical protein
MSALKGTDAMFDDINELLIKVSQRPNAGALGSVEEIKQKFVAAYGEFETKENGQNAFRVVTELVKKIKTHLNVDDIPSKALTDFLIKFTLGIFKHARSSVKRAFKKSKRRKGGKKTLARTVNRILNAKLEVKHASACSQAYANIAHNNLHVVDANIFIVLSHAFGNSILVFFVDSARNRRI